ncbi:phosphatase PAP2 family protein [Polymorphobacter arshaanensis]|nr:phosphatase PAP2 family protein [Polymorphobacter arshaanensis]
MKSILSGAFAPTAGVRAVCVAFGAAVLLAPAAAQANAVTDVNAALVAAIRSAAMAPPGASRAIAMVDIAVFDAVNAATGLRYDAYFYTGTKASGVSADAAGYVAGYTMLAKLFPAQASALTAAMHTSVAALHLTPARQAAAMALGSGIANGYFAARANDGAATAQTPYVFGTNPGDFQSVNAGAQPVLPSWGKVDPFVMASAGQFSLGAPPALGSAAWVASYTQVRDLGCVTCGTAWQQDTARFWADDGGGTVTPPGHWVEIAADISVAQRLDLLASARLSAMVGVAMADAGISAWDIKYTYDFWRPVTAVRACTLALCGSTGDIEWTPYLPTPNFPSYVSGHSSFSGAGAAALANFFGSDSMNFCVESDPLAGLATRCFTSFAAAAAESGISRIYGGVHYQLDNAPGLGMGGDVGDYVVSHAFQLAAVPEPASWTLLVAGFGVVGATARRHRAVTDALLQPRAA